MHQIDTTIRESCSNLPTIGEGVGRQVGLLDVAHRDLHAGPTPLPAKHHVPKGGHRLVQVHVGLLPSLVVVVRRRLSWRHRTQSASGEWIRVHLPLSCGHVQRSAGVSRAGRCRGRTCIVKWIAGRQGLGFNSSLHASGWPNGRLTRSRLFCGSLLQLMPCLAVRMQTLHCLASSPGHMSVHCQLPSAVPCARLVRKQYNPIFQNICIWFSVNNVHEC